MACQMKDFQRNMIWYKTIKDIFARSKATARFDGLWSENRLDLIIEVSVLIPLS